MKNILGINNLNYKIEYGLVTLSNGDGIINFTKFKNTPILVCTPKRLPYNGYQFLIGVVIRELTYNYARVSSVTLEYTRDIYENTQGDICWIAMGT